MVDIKSLRTSLVRCGGELGFVSRRQVESCLDEIESLRAQVTEVASRDARTLHDAARWFRRARLALDSTRTSAGDSPAALLDYDHAQHELSRASHAFAQSWPAPEES